MGKMTQAELVVKYMGEFGSITTLQAFNDLGCVRLASRICDIRRSGIRVYSRKVGKANRWGEKCYVSEYSLKPFEDEKA